MISNRDDGIRRCMSSWRSTGQGMSNSPQAMSVGTRTRRSISCWSGRDRNASDWRTNTSGPGFRPWPYRDRGSAPCPDRQRDSSASSPSRITSRSRPARTFSIWGPRSAFTASISALGLVSSSGQRGHALGRLARRSPWQRCRPWRGPPARSVVAPGPRTSPASASIESCPVIVARWMTRCADSASTCGPNNRPSHIMPGRRTRGVKER